MYLVLREGVSRLPAPVGRVEAAEGDGGRVVVAPEEDLSRRVGERDAGGGDLEVGEHGAEDGAAVHEVPDRLLQRRRARQRVHVQREQVEDVAGRAQLQQLLHLRENEVVLKPDKKYRAKHTRDFFYSTT